MIEVSLPSLMLRIRLPSTKSIKTVGYVTPIIVDEDNVILAGHGRYEVMRTMEEFAEIEVVQLSGLSQLEKDKFRLYDNQSARTGHYDNELLLGTIENILKADGNFNISILGIDGLADAFSTDVFSFDLGKVSLDKQEEMKRYLIVIDDNIDGAIEMLNSGGYKYSLGYATKK